MEGKKITRDIGPFRALFKLGHDHLAVSLTHHDQPFVLASTFSKENLPARLEALISTPE